MSLEGKYALVTGSSRGIGRGIAVKLAGHGVKIAINYCRNKAAADDTLAKVRGLGSNGFVVQAFLVGALRDFEEVRTQLKLGAINN